MSPLQLSFREHGPSAAPGLPLLLIHGLFGASGNWQGIARRLGESRRILVPDLRNHGDSPWDGRMDYRAMAEDLESLLDRLGIARAHLAGHSMGGKAAMWLALTRPDRVGSLVVADMAPISYEGRFGGLVAALEALPLATLADRREADLRLSAEIRSPAVRAYLLTNLIRVGDAWRWRMNLDAIAASMGEIQGFPDTEGRQFLGPVLFVYGGRSDYVTGAGLASIRGLFPLARLRAIPEAGHWVYADRPDDFVAALGAFLSDR